MGNVPLKHWRSFQLKRTWPHTSKRNLTKRTTPHGTVWSAETLGRTLLTRRSTSFISISDRLRSCYLNRDRGCPPTTTIYTWPTVTLSQSTATLFGPSIYSIPLYL